MNGEFGAGDGGTELRSKKMTDAEIVNFRAVPRSRTVDEYACGVEAGSRTMDVSVDLVNHPPHYKDGGIETIDFIEAKKLNYNLGNAVKYITRAGKKDRDFHIQDLEKAAWYLQREISNLKLKRD